MKTVPKSRDFILIFSLQLITMVGVVVIFRNITPKYIAALCAGSLFIATDLAILMTVGKWQRFQKHSLFWIAGFRLLIISIPMVVQRAMTISTDFTSVKIWGLPGPLFHGLANGVSLLLLIATIGEFYFFRSRSSSSQDPKTN